MASYLLLNLILQVVVILWNSSDIKCQTQTAASATSSSSSGASSSFRYYSKSTGEWKTVNYTIPEGDNSEGSTPGGSRRLSTPEECARPCTSGAPPKTCHYQWTFEVYHTFGGACQICSPTTNTSISSDCQCILADGADVSGIIVANRQLPGPSIQVCIGDMVIIDIKNMVTGNALSIHWHGLYQKDFQHYDGVPFVTQCPISPNSEFRYQWRAQNPGTHFWHAHSGVHKADGADGLIVVRTPIEDDPNRNFYDHDGLDHHMFIQDWLHANALDHFPGTTFNNIGQIPDNFLFNGRGQWLDPDTGLYTNTPLTVYNVRQGQRYRIRMVNSCSLICPVELQIENHNLTIISLDGSDIQPHRVTTITSFSAERVDFVITANQPIGTYWIQLRGLGNECGPLGVQQHAILRYEGSMLQKPSHPRPSYNRGLPRGVIFNPLNDVCNGTTPNVVCVKDLRSSDRTNQHIYKSKPDVQIYLPFFFHFYDKNDLFRPNTYQRFMDPNVNLSLAAVVGGVSSLPPSSPPITQLEDIPSDALCEDTNNLPARCDGLAVCHCTHIINIPLNAVVELIVADIGPLGLSHPFHLHGYGYHVMGSGLLSRVNITNENRASALQRDRQAYPPRSYRPVVKDTLAVPSGGYTIVRFVADNPGWWFFHCHFLQHLYNGMSAVFHVGEDSDLPPAPVNFPKCGNFKPEILRSNPTVRSEL